MRDRVLRLVRYLGRHARSECDACGSWACMPVEGCDALAQHLYDARMPLDVQSCLPQLYFVSCEGECHAVVSL